MILQDSFAGLTNLDSAVMRTFIGLFKNPGQVSLEYVQGKRARYLSPVRYFLIIIALFVLGHWLLNEPLIPLMDMTKISADEVAYIKQINLAMTKYVNFILLMALPIFTWLMKLLFRKSGFNFAEVSCFAFYVVSQLLILGLLISPLKSLHAEFYLVLRMMVHVVFFTWATKVFFAKSWLHALLKSVLATILYANSVGLVLMVIVFLENL